MTNVGLKPIINVVRHLLKTTGYVSLKYDNGVVTLDSAHKVLRNINGLFYYYLDNNTVVTESGRIPLATMQEEARGVCYQPFISNYDQITGQLNELFIRIQTGALVTNDVFYITVNKFSVRIQSGYTSRTAYQIDGVHFGKEL